MGHYDDCYKQEAVLARESNDKLIKYIEASMVNISKHVNGIRSNHINPDYVRDNINTKIQELNFWIAQLAGL